MNIWNLVENLNHKTDGQQMTAHGFLACTECGGPMILFLDELSAECPKCGWNGPAFGKSLTEVWCARCGHVWDLGNEIQRRSLH